MSLQRTSGSQTNNVRLGGDNSASFQLILTFSNNTSHFVNQTL